MSTHDQHEGHSKGQAREEADPDPEQEVEEGKPPEHASTAPAHPVPSPGERAGGMWPGVNAVRADTDDSDEVEGVEDVALAPPGKPDGEADTRP